MGIAGVKATLRRLHGVKPPASGFLHHHGFYQLHIFRDAVLLGIFTDRGIIGFHFGAYRHVGAAATPAAEVIILRV